MQRFLAFLALAALTGCASGGMNEAACSTADWHAVGYEDGAAGKDISAFTAHRTACADHGVVANLESYRAGRDEGLLLFCRPANGYNLGSLGISYRGACPADLEKGFAAAYSDGYGLYQRQAALDGLTNRLERKRSRAKAVERLMAEKTAGLASGSLTPEDIANTAVEIKQLAEEQAQLASDIKRLKREQAKADEDYRIYEAHLAGRASWASRE